MTAVQQAALDTLVHGIITLVHPKRIVLFGSAARGEMKHESDLDILVVMPTGTHRRDTEKCLYRNRPNVGFSVDFVVVTEEDIEKYGERSELIILPALTEGVELYAA